MVNRFQPQLEGLSERIVPASVTNVDTVRWANQTFEVSPTFADQQVEARNNEIEIFTWQTRSGVETHIINSPEDRDRLAWRICDAAWGEFIQSLEPDAGPIQDDPMRDRVATPQRDEPFPIPNQFVELDLQQNAQAPAIRDRLLPLPHDDPSLRNQFVELDLQQDAQAPANSGGIEQNAEWPSRKDSDPFWLERTAFISAAVATATAAALAGYAWGKSSGKSCSTTDPKLEPATNGSIFEWLSKQYSKKN